MVALVESIVAEDYIILVMAKGETFKVDRVREQASKIAGLPVAEVVNDASHRRHAYST